MSYISFGASAKVYVANLKNSEANNLPTSQFAIKKYHKGSSMNDVVNEVSFNLLFLHIIGQLDRSEGRDTL